MRNFLIHFKTETIVGLLFFTFSVMPFFLFGITNNWQLMMGKSLGGFVMGFCFIIGWRYTSFLATRFFPNYISYNYETGSYENKGNLLNIIPLFILFARFFLSFWIGVLMFPFDLYKFIKRV